eukprot:8855410-Alexandrium_andersonii.AAC.1
MREVGYASHEFDRETRRPSEDICAVAGALWAGCLALRARAKGLLSIAAPCSSWVFISRGPQRATKSSSETILS